MAISISPGGSQAPIPTGSAYPTGGGVLPAGLGGGLLASQSGAQSQGTNVSTTRSTSESYIPDYAESPILRSIATQAQSMAPQVYQWGMDQYNKNQGNIDTMMRNAMSYASPSRISSEMGKAEAGVQQGAEAGRQSAIKDLQSYGIDPSSGRYAALDQASRVMSGAAAAGAGNVQREATTATGAQMQQAAQGLSLQNEQIGYGASNAANQLLSTGMQLKYPPLGTNASSSTDSSGQNTSTQAAESYQPPSASGSSSGSGSWGGGMLMPGTNIPWVQYKAEGGPLSQDDATTGGFVSQDLSPSAGAQTDDVKAQLNAGEFVIPKDVAVWKGQEFFYKLMAQARKMRATAGQESNGNGGMGYGNGNGDGDGGGDQMAGNGQGSATAPQQLGYGAS